MTTEHIPYMPEASDITLDASSLASSLDPIDDRTSEASVAEVLEVGIQPDQPGIITTTEPFYGT